MQGKEDKIVVEMEFSHVGTSLEEVGKGWASLPVTG